MCLVASDKLLSAQKYLFIDECQSLERRVGYHQNQCRHNHVLAGIGIGHLLGLGNLVTVHSSHALST